jgi:flagellar biosynthetic protein FliP
MLRRRRLLLAGILLAALLLAGCTAAGESAGSNVTFPVGLPGEPGEMSNTVSIMVFLTVLTLIPVILLVTTGFVRIVVVLSVVRNAIGMPQLPPNQVIVSLALILTYFVMAPALTRINSDALQPFMAGEIDQEEAWRRGEAPLREFMFKQTRETDLSLFVSLAHLPRPQNQEQVPTQVLVPAFVISELRTAFQMAFLIYVPFLVIDMVVGSALLSMGMMMLPPTVVSLPFKLLLFVLVDGWRLIAQSLVLSFH